MGPFESRHSRNIVFLSCVLNFAANTQLKSAWLISKKENSTAQNLTCTYQVQVTALLRIRIRLLAATVPEAAPSRHDLFFPASTALALQRIAPSSRLFSVGRRVSGQNGCWDGLSAADCLLPSQLVLVRLTGLLQRQNSSLNQIKHCSKLPAFRLVSVSVFHSSDT